MAESFMCTVDSAGASGAATKFLPADAIYLVLTDKGGRFRQSVFFAADSVKREMLAVALTAIATDRPVWALVDVAPVIQPDQLAFFFHFPSECYQLAIVVD
jgi:hypothetical protein